MFSPLKKLKKGAFLCFLIGFASLDAGPSSIFWTNCTTDIYSTGMGHLDEDVYFTLGNDKDYPSTLPTDTGLEFGLFTWKDLRGEGGVDYLGGVNDPLFFNFGMGMAEGKVFKDSPSFKVGIFNAGTKYKGVNRTSQNVCDLILGKSLPEWMGGSVFFGIFSGSRSMGKNRQGFMAAYQRFFSPAVYSTGQEYFKWMLCADYASGKNTIGGGGVAFAYYFNPDISVLTGPIWFNSKKINGNWKWSIQIGIDFPVLK